MFGAKIHVMGEMGNVRIVSLAVNGYTCVDGMVGVGLMPVLIQSSIRSGDVDAESSTHVAPEIPFQPLGL